MDSQVSADPGIDAEAWGNRSTYQHQNHSLRMRAIGRLHVTEIPSKYHPHDRKGGGLAGRSIKFWLNDSNFVGF